LQRAGNPTGAIVNDEKPIKNDFRQACCIQPRGRAYGEFAGEEKIMSLFISCYWRLRVTAEALRATPDRGSATRHPKSSADWVRNRIDRLNREPG
jgi:hypothetical protein